MPTLLERFANWVFRHRLALVLVFLLLTGVMTWFATRVRVDASFNKSLPTEHAYIQVFTKYQGEFGGANRVLIALMARDGDIFNAPFFATLKHTTDEVFFLPGVDRAQVQSLYTPNVRFVEVVEDGLAGGNVIPAGFEPTPEGFAKVRENVIKSGKIGMLVANDFSGAMISAQLLEVDPSTGAKLDYLRVADALESMRQRIERESGGAVQVHIIGFAKVMGDVGTGARGVLLLFGISILVTALLVWSYAGRWKLAAMPIVCSLVAVVWQIGSLSALGYGVEPLSLLVPFLVFAIGVSHGVQMVRAFRSEMMTGAEEREAGRKAFLQLLVPGGVALLADTVGFLTILVIKIQSIRELAISASLGVGVIIITNLFLLPILLSFLHLPESYHVWVRTRQGRTNRFWARLASEMKPVPSLLIIAVCLGLGVWGWAKSQQVQIGDIHAGVPELWPESRYNRDTRTITSKFSIGVDQLSVIVETVPNGCVDHEVVTLMDQLDGHLRAVPGVQSVMSIAAAAKIVNAGWNEGSLKWRILPRHPQALAQAVSPIETATGLLNPDGSVLPVIVFLADHKADTLRRVTAAVEEFAAAHPSDKVKLRLAGGNAGVMAATNEVVEAAQFPIVVWVFGAVIALCLVTFRSVRATLCIVLPLLIVSYLGYALMVYLKIGLKTSTLPVVALGVGIGVDYGIYLFARLQNALRRGEYFEDAMYAAFQETGSAILFTGLTLAIGVSLWYFSALKFQADMGVLLTFMFLVNMLGALLLLPAMARWLYRHHTRKG
ncbi:MAG TPA: MMPL family transporter [Opitutaceae bacterium]|nr:MMPL family transporter [Opitutaceae bacterium]HOY55065.1 MMPL family transporter [Opitutaceae bacterium]HPG18266.1 MMPL family transporter [Opitutaceae bacterium]HPN99352.1 MMPL family transporter [Opitutaceae bacterium]